MAINILVVDSSEQFGTLVQQSLEAEGDFEVTVATSASDAVHLATLHEFRLAIVDLDLPRNTGLDLLRIWSNQKPEMSLVAVPLAGNEQMLQHLDVPIHGVLYKPFYLPDLPAIIQSALASKPLLHGRREAAAPATPQETSQPAEPKPSSPPLESSSIREIDFDSILTAMKQVTDGKRVLATLITRNGQPWTDIGILSPEQKHTVFSTIHQAIQAERPQAEVFRYMDILGFDEAPLFYFAPLEAGREVSVLLSPFVSITTARQAARRISEAMIPAAIAETRTTAGPKLHEKQVLPSAQLRTGAEEHAAPAQPLPADWVPQEPPSVKPATGGELPQAPARTTPARPAAPAQAVDLPADWIPEPDTRAKFSAGVRSPAALQARSPALQPAAVTPQIQLPYSMVFIPRFPEHRLVGMFSEKLRNWSLRLCVAWDWRMVDLLIDPDYLSFTLQLSPEIPPATVVSTLQEELSAKIFEAYPDLLTDLPSRRFWTTSHLLLTGPAPPQDQIRAFLAETRKAQGL